MSNFIKKFGPCTKCAEQCVEHGGGKSHEEGCLCNDGYKIEKCKEDDQDVSDSKRK